MSSCASLLAQLKGYCNSRGISIKDEFHYYDRKNTGFLPEELFRRFFVSIRFTMSEQQFQSISQNYKTENGLYDIQKFINDVETSDKYSSHKKIDTITILSELKMLRGFLATNNTTLRDLFRPYDPNFRGYVSQNSFFRELGNAIGMRRIADKYTFDPSLGVFYPAIEKDLADLPDFTQKEKPDLSGIAGNVLFQGIDVASAFSQYDRYRTGRLTPENFAAAVRDFCPNDVNEITKYYEDCDGLCDTKRFCRDVFNQTQTIKTMPKRPKTPPTPPDPKEVMQRIKTSVYNRRINIQDAFPQDAKTVPFSVFYNIIQSLGFGLSVEDVDAIANVYKSGKDVDLTKFFDYFVPEPPKPYEVPVPEIRDYLKKTHQQLRPFCLRADREKTGEIDAYQLHSIMNRVGFALNRLELDAIARVFRGNNPGTVKYEELCMAVDPSLNFTDSQKIYFQQEAEREKKERELARQRSIPFQESIIPILQKINYNAERKSVMVNDEIREIDRLRCGFINQQQLNDALSFASLSPDEQEQLWNAYSDGKYGFLIQDLQDPRAAPIKKVTHEVNEHLSQVLSELKGVLQTRSLTIYDVIGDRNTLATRAAAQLSRYTPEASLIVDTFRDEKRPELVDSIGLFEAIHNVPVYKKTVYRDNENAVYLDLIGIRQKLDARHKNIKSLFNGCPDFISFDELIKRIESANIIVEGRESERLQRKFLTPDGVDWKYFVTEIENSSTLAPVY